MPVDVAPPSLLDAVAAAPFLKWAGGKRQLLPQLRQYVPASFGAYHEPFLGSAALFFDLRARGRLQQAYLTDTNAALVACYEAVRRTPAQVIDALTHLALGHAAEGSRHYYAARARFNAAAAGAHEADGAVDRAALFIYLNRTGFNGLYRLNSQGHFNVPAGRYRNPRICDALGLNAAARALQPPAIDIAHAPWPRVLDAARADDFVYLDPPYAPVSATARFTSYTAGGFDEADQRALADAVCMLARRGCHVVLSNSTAPLIESLYERSAAMRAAGLRVHRVPARRAISARAGGRGDVFEVIVTNVPPRGTP